MCEGGVFQRQRMGARVCVPAECAGVGPRSASNWERRRVAGTRGVAEGGGEDGGAGYVSTSVSTVERRGRTAVGTGSLVGIVGEGRGSMVAASRTDGGLHTRHSLSHDKDLTIFLSRPRALVVVTNEGKNRPARFSPSCRRYSRRVPFETVSRLTAFSQNLTERTAHPICFCTVYDPRRTPRTGASTTRGPITACR